MSSFRKRPKGFKPCYSVPPLIREVVNNETVENGISLKRESVVLRTVEESFLKHPVPQEDYGIGAQLQAGVSLRDIPCSTLLDSPDNLDYPDMENVEEKILTDLNSETNE